LISPQRSDGLSIRTEVVASFLAWAFALSPHLWASPQSSDQASVETYSKVPVVFEKISSKVVVQNDGTATEETAVRVRIQSEAGVQQLGVLNFPYASATSTLQIAYVRVTKPNDTVVQTPTENFLDMPADITRQAPFYSDIKEMQVAVKGLQVGDILEYDSVVNESKPVDPGQFWYAFNFSENVIVLQEELQISIPSDKYVNVKSAKVQPTVTQQGLMRVYDWKTSNLTTDADKAAAAPDPDRSFLPSVALTTFHTWDEVGQWFRGLAAPRATPTPEIQVKADELTHDAKTDVEKTEAFYNFVSTKFRYIGISLGIGRYQPHAAADVLSNGYGDCKDKSTLLTALLAASGIKAYPALISSSGKIDPDMPYPGQFDHVITALPHGASFTFLDTTTEVGPFGYLVPTLRGAKALVIPDSGPATLIETAPNPPFKSFFNFQSEGSLDDSGTYQGKMQISTRGDLELAYRFAFREAGEAQWTPLMQKASGNLGFGGTVTSTTISAPDATDAPFQIQYNYKREKFGDWDDKQITAPLPPVFVPEAPDETVKLPKPIVLGSPVETDYTATMKLPPNANPALLPNLDLQEDFAGYRSTYSFSAGVMRVERQLTTKTKEVTVTQMDAYRKFVKAIVGDETTFIRVFGTGQPAEFSGTAEARQFWNNGQSLAQAHGDAAAAKEFQKATDADPKFAQAWLSLGSIHFRQGHHDQGASEMKKAVALDYTNATFYRYVGSLLVSNSMLTDALEVWRGAEKANPHDPDAPRNIASIYEMQKNFVEAQTELESAVKAIPDNPALTLQLGVVYIRTGDKEKAISTINKAVQMKRQDPEILNEAAYELADSNLDMDDALRYSQIAVQAIENATSAIALKDVSFTDFTNMVALTHSWDTLGWAYFRSGRIDLAEKYVNAAWNLTQFSAVGDHLGQIYERENRHRDAAIAYGLALATGRPPEETRSRMEAIQPMEARKAGERVNAEGLQALRTFNVERKVTKHEDADFFMLLGAGGKVLDVKFISGANELQDAGKLIRDIKFDASFPDDNPTQILRRGILDCEPELSSCTFVLIPTDSVHSIN
jgi:tetratricopeptide (TPR) repeat protein